MIELSRPSESASLGDPTRVSPASFAPRGSVAPRIVYVAMKPQLRGRIRRNVATLLELGADVTVLTIASGKDFFVGLENPRLHAEYLPARSLYVRVSQHASRRGVEKAARRRSRAAARREQPGARSRAWLAPLYLLLGALVALGRFAGWLTLPVAHAFSLLMTVALRHGARSWRRLPIGWRRRGWALARWQVGARRSLRLRWRMIVRPHVRTSVDRVTKLAWELLDHRVGLRLTQRQRRPRRRRQTSLQRWAQRRRVLLGRAVLRRRRSLARWLLNHRLMINRAMIKWLKDRLRPWHRTSRFLAFWRESAERIAALAPEMVVSSDLPGLVGAGRAARQMGLPHLHDCHELYLDSTSFRPSERLLLAPFERKYMRHADSVVGVNQSIAEEYARRYGRKPVVVRNCAPRMPDVLDVKDLRALVGAPAGSRVVLYQGGFAPGRGLDVCVSAIRHLPDDVHLILLGYGALRDDLVLLAQDFGVSSRVHVADAVSPEDLPSYTVTASVGLIPYQPISKNNYLALPNKVFEYTAVGVPIVVSNLPELRRIALQEGCGQVYDPFDARSLVSALNAVLDENGLSRYRAAALRYGGENVWESEREILTKEIHRVFPALRDLVRPVSSGVLSA